MKWGVVVAGSAMLIGSVNVQAELRLDPYLSSYRQYQSNVFSVSSAGQAAAQNNGDPTRADNQTTYVAGTDAKWEFGRQTLTATIEGSRFTYNHFSALDHDEYRWLGKLEWQLGRRWEGTLGVRQQRRMAAYENRNSSQLALELERIIDGTAQIHIAPDWRIDTAASRRDLNSPLPGYQNFTLTENSGTAGLKYLGVSRLAAGFEFVDLVGAYSGISNAPDFAQQTAQLTANYLVSGLSRLDAGLGWTHRQDHGGDNATTQALTGNFAISRRLSGKTAMDVHLFRRVNSYTAGTSTVIDTGVGTGVRWEATPLLAVNLAYDWTQSAFQAGTDAQADAENGQLRRDYFQAMAVTVSYQPRNWLIIKPYGGYQARTSSVAEDSFNGAVMGLEAKLRF